jgi:DNA polymerase sigma
MAKELKIMIFITKRSAEEARGKQIVQLLERLMNTFKQNSDIISDSIISVVTQVKPTDDEFDLYNLKVNLDAQLRNSLKNFTYEKEISNELLE